MTDELKVAVEPEEVKSAEVEPVFESKRAQIEKLVQTENENFADEAPAEEVAEVPAEEIALPVDPVEQIKKSVQKRIDKVVAQKKSVEEENAELKAELERLKSSPKPDETVSTAEKGEAEVTPEQVEAYIAKMSEEGNHKEVAAATRYLIKLEKEIALKEVREQQTKAQAQTESEKARTNQELRELAQDYVAYDDSGAVDASSDLNLSNQKGLLFKTAMSLYNDKELHAELYNNPNVVQGFRRAVSDAFIQIHQQGLVKHTPKGQTIIPERKNPRMSLAEPSAEVSEESVQSTNVNSLTDAQKASEEIKNRMKNRYLRKIPQ